MMNNSLALNVISSSAIYHLKSIITNEKQKRVVTGAA